MLAVGFEAAFWIMLVAFLVLRYRYGIESVTRLFAIGVLLDTAGLVGLGVWDFIETGRLSVYTLVILGLIVYSLSFGRAHLERLDRWVAERWGPRPTAATPARCN
jgi:hypothetical protein